MKIDKAIELLTRWQKNDDITSFYDINIAIRLSLEALERHQVRASMTYMDMMKPLPGED